MSPVDGGAGVLQFREVEDDFIEADALNFRHRGLSGKHRVVMTESHVYLQTAPGATLPMLPYLPKVRAGPDLVKDIDRDVQLLKRHLPYHESDHVLNIAFNLLA